ncbi:MAG: DGQHR domain-containing protein [Candidatus Bipolaricaulota bacterium]|nr:DGQHR domain-containing protein [Candidatus Bipolaricaulota bacterium]MCS7274559.1 DGQHR domain-containing protein [Candidatus Bipolaricaulota bacterium]MDW8111011.1 DGQHR domain-containing protein [Candidatus Bipolaricaulota bacterium]
MATTRVRFHTAFEQKIYSFLEKFAQADQIALSGGADFFLFGHQIDAAFEYQNYRVVIECKEKDAPVISLLEPINKLSSVIAEARRAEPHKTYLGVIVVNFDWAEIKPEDVQKANSQGLKIWTAERVRFYDKLIDALNPELALLSLFKDEFGITRDTGRVISVPAIKTTRFGKDLLTFELEASKLMPLAYVFRLADPHTEAYQRMIDKDRLMEIAAELSKEKLEVNFPNNIIVSFEEGVRWEPTDGNVGILQIPERYGIAWVIDGQHRLYSFCKLQNKEIAENFKLIVTAFQNLTKAEQATVFRTVNNKQKKINANLVDFLLSKEVATDDPRSIAARVIIRFHEEKFFDYEIDCGFNGGLLKLSSLCSGLVRHGLIGRSKLLQKTPKDESTPYHVLKQYLLAVKETFPTNWKKENSFVQSNAGLNIFFALLKKIIRHMGIPKERLDELRQRDFEKYLEPLKLTKFTDELKKFAATESGRAAIVKMLSGKIEQKFKGFAEL